MFMDTPFQSFFKSWWIFLLLGIIVFLLGLGAIFDPLPAYMAFSTFIWLSFILTGIIQAASSVVFRKSVPYWWANLIIAILLILIGISVATDALSRLLLPIYVFAFGLIIQGFNAVFAALALKKEGAGWALTLVCGIISVLIGLFLPFHPLIGIGTVGLFVGMALLVVGLEFIVSGFFLYKLKKATDL